MASRKAQRLKKLLGLAEALPEIEISGEQHLAFRIRKKTVAYYLDDHHGDGIVSLCCKATPEQQKSLLAEDPELYYVPAYLGSRGWVAIRLDRPKAEWGRVADLLFEAYRAQAPQRLARQLD